MKTRRVNNVRRIEARVVLALFAFIIIAGLVAVAGQPPEGKIEPSPGTIYDANPPTMPFGPALEIISKPYLYGEMTLELKVLLNYPFDSLIIEAEPVGPLSIIGQQRWIIYPRQADDVIIPLQVNIPQNDTTGLKIDIDDEKGPKNGTERVFITTGDTLEIYHWLPPKYDKIYITADGRELTEEEYIRERDSIYREWDKMRPMPGTTKVKTSIEKHPDAVLAETDEGRKELMEREPLVDHDRQIIYVDGQPWIRDSGEYKFRPAITSLHPSHPDYVRPQRQKSDAGTAIYHVVLDLRKKADYDKVMSLVDQLEAMERDGFYQVKVDRTVLTEIEKSGIPYSIYPRYPGERSKERKRPNQDAPEQKNTASKRRIFEKTGPTTPQEHVYNR
ncbi:MAG: hypothetical protein ACFFEW_14600 [Candidatus Thorarchaeota archaeon]